MRPSPDARSQSQFRDRGCDGCGRRAPGAGTGAAWPFDGRRLCRRCARLAVTLPPALHAAALRLGPRSLSEVERASDLSESVEASLVAALVGPLERAPGAGPLVAGSFGGWPGPGELDALHPGAAAVLRGLTLFREAGDGAWGGDEGDVDCTPLHRVGILREGVAGRLEGRIDVGEEVEDRLRDRLLVGRPFRTLLPPELDADTVLPPGAGTELSLAALVPWRLRARGLEHGVRMALQERASAARRRACGPARSRELFVEHLRLPEAAWRDRLALLVSARDGLRTADGDGAARGGRFVAAPRSGQDAEADADRKRCALAFLLGRLPEGRGPDGRLEATDVETLHALYAPSLRPDLRGWSRLDPTLEVGEGEVAERPTFTVAVPPDVMARGLEEGAAEEIARQVDAELADALLLVDGDGKDPRPVAPGPGVLTDLARCNDGGGALRPRIDGRLAALEDGGEHPLCGCDACLRRTLHHLRGVFLLMPFRRSNRRIVYNFLLTHYLLRCRATRVADGRSGSGIDGPDVPAVHWWTSEFCRRGLEGQIRLVRDGQERFRRFCRGAPLRGGGSE